MNIPERVFPAELVDMRGHTVQMHFTLMGPGCTVDLSAQAAGLQASVAYITGMDRYHGGEAVGHIHRSSPAVITAINAAPAAKGKRSFGRERSGIPSDVRDTECRAVLPYPIHVTMARDRACSIQEWMYGATCSSYRLRLR